MEKEMKLETLLNHSLGRIYWRKMSEARKNGDEIAVNYWEVHALRLMGGQDKKRNFIKG